MRLKISASAERDLDAIFSYLAKTAGNEVALNYVLRIEENCLGLCLAPGKGMRVPLFPRLRKINVGAHKIFYRQERDQIVIHRIWDGRRGSKPRLH